MAKAPYLITLEGEESDQVWEERPQSRPDRQSAILYQCAAPAEVIQYGGGVSGFQDNGDESGVEQAPGLAAILAALPPSAIPRGGSALRGVFPKPLQGKRPVRSPAFRRIWGRRRPPEGGAPNEFTVWATRPPGFDPPIPHPPSRGAGPFPHFPQRGRRQQPSERRTLRMTDGAPGDAYLSGMTCGACGRTSWTRGDPAAVRRRKRGNGSKGLPLVSSCSW